MLERVAPMNPFGAATGLGTNPFGAATGLGKASVDSALERAVDGTANGLARLEMGATHSAAAVSGPAAAKGASAVSCTAAAVGSSVASRAGGVAAASKPAAPKKHLGIRMPRAHLGTTPMKFSFQAQDLKVTLSTVGFEGRLVLAFKRGNDRRETEPMQLTEEVRCALHGTLQIHCEDIQPNG